MYEKYPKLNASSPTWTDNLICAAGKFVLYSGESWCSSELS